MNYKGLRDRHLNIFCLYGIDNLENNITKALINTLDSLPLNAQKELFKIVLKDVDDELIEGEVKTSFYLQKKPNDEIINRVPVKNRYLIGISPTGKCWGYNSQDVHDAKRLRDEIRKEVELDKALSDEKQEEIVEKTVRDILSIRERNDSIPDAWILIEFANNNYLIIIENKLYNLDPNQINNHIEKSLGQKHEKNKPIYIEYNKIIEKMRTLNTYLSNQFVEYMMILGYAKVPSIIDICDADETIRKDLMIKKGFEIMNDLFGSDCDYRDKNTIRKKLNKGRILQEINLCFSKVTRINVYEKDEDLYIYFSLALAPTMNLAKKLYRNNIEIPLKFKDNHFGLPKCSLHFQNTWGKNIKGSYVEENLSWPIEDYINFWKDNLNDLKPKSLQELNEFVEKLHNKGIYLQNEKNFKSSKTYIVPEIIYTVKWYLGEIRNMRNDDELKQSIKKALSEFLKKCNMIV
ncbi:MAG: hypothetical protein SO253_00690 [Bacilli bacterium]|nr:hypothetical protein [Bacilli bacterium]